MMMQTIIDEDLPMQVDCVQWHPQSNEIIAVGAYQLSTATTDTREGRLYLLQLTPNVPGGFSVVLEHQTAGGVLDLKFYSPSPSTTLIAIGTSSGLYIFDLKITPEFKLTPITAIETNILSLYLQWITTTTPNQDNTNRLIFSDAEGYLNLVSNEEEGGNGFKIVKRKKLHDALTWICHYSSEHHVCYSGCDDGKFTAFSFEDFMRDELHFVKKFEVGVTSICSKEGMVVVGGYDDILKIFSLTSTNPKPALQLKTQINLGGAVWRTMFLPPLAANKSSQQGVWTLAVATARKGIKFVEYDGTTLSVVKEQMKYEGFLAYGLDVVVNWEENCYRVASGYFDNHVVHCFSLS